MAKDFGDEKTIIDLVENSYQRYRRYRYNFERVWYRNLLFLMGIQWIIWDETEKRWRKRRLRNWVPTPVTNRYASTAERIVAVISRIEPNWMFVPGSESEADMASAKVADQLEPVIAEENEIDVVREIAAKWLVYTGNAYLFASTEEKGEKLDPETGQMVKEYKQYTDVYSPFELYADLSVPRIKDQERVLIVGRKDKEYIKRIYKVEANEEEPHDLGLRYLESLGYISSDLGIGDYAYFRDHRIPRTTLKRLLVKPNEDWPEGLYAVKAGDKLVESIALPKSLDGEPMMPIVQMKFDSIPGAFFARTPLNDLVPKQIQRNKLESMMELITLRMSNPIWRLPEGTRVAGFSGEPGFILKYTQVGERSAPPDRIPGEQIPGSLFNWLEQMDKDFEEIGAMFEALKGQAPYSGAPGVVVDRLIEQGLSRYGPVLRNVAEGYREWMKLQLELFRLYGTTPRKLSVLGENARWKLRHFTNADFKGAVNVRIESDSTIPRSEHAQSARVLAAINSNLITMDDPLDRLQLLKKLHLGDLAKTINEDVVNAVKEHELLMALPPEQVQALTAALEQGQSGLALMPPLPIEPKPFLHNHDVHIMKHRSFAMSDEGKSFELLMIVHITKHRMIQAAEMTPEGQVPMPEGGGNGSQPKAGAEAKETLAPKPTPGPALSPQSMGMGGQANAL